MRDITFWDDWKNQWTSYFKNNIHSFDSLPAFNIPAKVNDYLLFDWGNKLYVAGQFRTIDNQVRNSIALIHKEGGVSEPLGVEPNVGVRKWGNSIQSSLYLPGEITSMKVLGNMIYVAGDFNIAGDVAVSNVARYNIESKKWHDVDGGIDGKVNVMLYNPSDDCLYFGGNFSFAGQSIVSMNVPLVIPLDRLQII